MSEMHPIQGNSQITSIHEIDFEKNASLLKEKLSPERFEKAAQLSSLVRVFGITYHSNGKSISGYIVEPRNFKEKIPGIIFNRGGTQDFGAIKLGTLFTKLAEMSSWGYIVFASQYSGGPNSEGVDEWGGDDLNDVLKLHEIMKTHPSIDETRTGMVGESRGGMMTYLALKKLPTLKAVVVSSGITNLLRMKDFRPEMWEMFNKIFSENVEEKCKDRSILFSAEELPSTTPILILHGTADWRVSTLDALQLSEKLSEYKKPYRLVVYEGADHGLSEVIEEAMIETKDWLDKYVRDGHPLPDLTLHGI